MGFSPPEKISLGGPALPPTTNYDKMWSITRQYGKPSSLPLILFFPLSPACATFCKAFGLREMF